MEPFTPHPPPPTAVTASPSCREGRGVPGASPNCGRAPTPAPASLPVSTGPLPPFPLVPVPGPAGQRGGAAAAPPAAPCARRPPPPGDNGSPPDRAVPPDGGRRR